MNVDTLMALNTPVSTRNKYGGLVWLLFTCRTGMCILCSGIRNVHVHYSWSAVMAQDNYGLALLFIQICQGLKRSVA